MYFLSTKMKLGDLNGDCDIFSMAGFIMPSKRNCFRIQDQIIKNIKIINISLARPMVTHSVQKKYKKLLSLLTELLISDDDSGEAFREALNQIEKFRLEIKNQFRVYLEKEELDKMGKQLSALHKEAQNRIMELQYSYMASQSKEGKNR